VFRQRAKLYRYDDNAWKERGTGDMKILKNPLTGLCAINLVPSVLLLIHYNVDSF